MGFQITLPSGIYKRQPLFFLFNVAANWMLLPIRKAALPVLNIKHFSRSVRKLQMGLTIASPHLGQMAAALAGLFTELDDIAARCFRGDGHLSHGLLPVTEVHRQYHLKGEGRQWGENWIQVLNSEIWMTQITIKTMECLWMNLYPLYCYKACSADTTFPCWPAQTVSWS